MPNDTCDHTSVGMLVWRDEKLLLIERRKPPYGFAPPAGHVDADDSFEQAAARELQEEVGLKAATLEVLWEGRRENPCRRKDGTWHFWKIYRVHATGEVQSDPTETKQAGWYSISDIAELRSRTGAYLSGDVSDSDWNDRPGLENIWYELSNEIGLLTPPDDATAI